MNPGNDNAGRTITTLSSREVYRNHWMRLREDEILRSNGEKGIYGVVEKHDGAIILPIDEGRVWLVEQFRYTIQERTLELPQGSWERKVENPEELARGELKEELGLHAAAMTYLGMQWIAYGFLRQKLHVFLATGLTATEKTPDAEEHDLVVRSVTVAEFEEMILAGTIRDGCTMAAWGLYLLRKARQESIESVTRDASRQPHGLGASEGPEQETTPALRGDSNSRIAMPRRQCAKLTRPSGNGNLA
jgi:8-oxo-dGTP pyrophosphatase MutT (NUDIX family)